MKSKRRRSKSHTTNRTKAQPAQTAFTPDEEEFFRAGDSIAEGLPVHALDDHEDSSRRPGLLTRLLARWQTS